MQKQTEILERIDRNLPQTDDLDPSEAERRKNFRQDLDQLRETLQKQKQEFRIESISANDPGILMRFQLLLKGSSNSVAFHVGIIKCLPLEILGEGDFVAFVGQVSIDEFVRKIGQQRFIFHQVAQAFLEGIGKRSTRNRQPRKQIIGGVHRRAGHLPAQSFDSGIDHGTEHQVRAGTGVRRTQFEMDVRASGTKPGDADRRPAVHHAGC